MEKESNGMNMQRCRGAIKNMETKSENPFNTAGILK
jgi:hypothetical protein